MQKLKTLLSDEEIQELSKKVPPGHKPLWEYWEEFVDDYIDFEGRSPVTIKSTQAMLQILLRHTAIVSIEQCNDPQILRHELRRIRETRGWRPVTYNTYLKNINTHFRWLESCGYIMERKTNCLRKVKETIQEQHTMSPDSVKRIIAYLFTNENKNTLYRWRNIVFFQLLAQVGARPSEILAIQMKDLKFQGKTCVLTVKGEKTLGKPRRFPLTGTLVDNLKHYLDLRGVRREGLTHLFVSCSNKDKPMGKSGMRKLFQVIGDEVGVKITATAFRRYVATVLRKNGKSLDQIADYLGHSRTSTTKRYIEQLPDLNDECAQTMHDMLWGPSQATDSNFTPNDDIHE